MEATAHGCLFLLITVLGVNQVYSANLTCINVSKNPTGLSKISGTWLIHNSTKWAQAPCSKIKINVAARNQLKMSLNVGSRVQNLTAMNNTNNVLGAPNGTPVCIVEYDHINDFMIVVANYTNSNLFGVVWVLGKSEGFNRPSKIKMEKTLNGTITERLYPVDQSLSKCRAVGVNQIYSGSSSNVPTKPVKGAAATHLANVLLYVVLSLFTLCKINYY